MGIFGRGNRSKDISQSDVCILEMLPLPDFDLSDLTSYVTSCPYAEGTPEAKNWADDLKLENALAEANSRSRNFGPLLRLSGQKDRWLFGEPAALATKALDALRELRQPTVVYSPRIEKDSPK